ncbi:HEXXH motif-containing putative peptide modification protein [Streptomyces sp. NPDC021056]|uniref:aKG-HExxH-type peptide beta-hydroxylase n=1 Tax=Streptomyces sp. NPDC021056 TaxID=3155012 RepID=UPI0033DBE607
MTTTDFLGGHLALAGDDDPVLPAYVAKLRASVPRVTKRLGQLAGEPTEAELTLWGQRFAALDDDSAHRLLSHPVFPYLWRQLMLAAQRKDADFIRAWSTHFARFVALPHATGPAADPEGTEVRTAAPVTEVRFPQERHHLVFDTPVHRLVIREDGDGTVRDGSATVPASYIHGAGDSRLGDARRVRRPVIAGTDIEIDNAGPSITRHFTSMNSHEPQPGYPRSDLAVREIGEDDITDISRAFALIEDVWPELATEIRAYTRVVVPYASEFHSSFTEAILMGAVFLSEAAQPFSATHYTAEHLLHESSHLRLMLLLELDPLVTVAEGATFNSPVRKDPRPLWGMLMAVHAFARITAFHRRAHGRTGREIHRELTRQNADLLAKGLDEIEGEPTAEFTEAGKVLWAQMRAETEAAPR